MKKLFRTVLAVAVAAAAMTSCAKELSEKFESGVKVDMVGSMPETKTAFADPSGSQYPVIWKEGDNVAVIVNFGTGTPTALPVTPSADGKTAKFSAELPASIDPPYTFMVISPRNAWVSVNSTDKRLNYLIPSTQTASKNVVDPAAQVLVGVTDEITELPADAIPITFKHAVAYGKITLKNLDVEGRAIQSITVKSETPIAGRWFYTPSTGDFAVNSGSNSIEIKTSDTEDVLFAAAPADISDKKLTVSVSVYGGVYTKEITVPAEKTFKVGTISKFSVDMTGATFEKSKVYTLLKNASALKEGDEIVMASSAPVLMTKEGKTPKTEAEVAAASKLGIVALGTQQNGNNRTGIVITDLYDETAGTITSPGDAVEVFTVEKGTADGTFAFKGKNGQYIVRPKQSGNYLRSQNANDDAAGWTVTLRNEPKFSQYAMDIVTTNAQYTATAKYIQINPNTGNQIVSCYANTQQEICIFVYDPSAGPVDKKDVVKWVPSAAGSEVFANGDGDVTVEPTTADWLTWDKATKTVAWTEAAMPRQAKLTFTNGSTYDLTQIDAKVMAGDWTLTSFQRFTGHISSTKKFSATSEGNTGNQKILPSGTYPTTSIKLAVMTDQALTANTASGSIWAVKSHTNNMTIEGLAEEGLLAKAEFKMDETKASLGIFLQQPLVKAEDLSAPVHFTTTGFTDYYPWLMPELATVNTNKSIKAWRLDFGSLGSDSKYWYEGVITVKGEETTISWLANNVDDRPALSTSTSYRVAGLMVDAFSIGSTEIGSNSTSKIGNYTLLRNVSSDAKTVAAASTASAAYFKVYQGDMILTKSAIVPPTPVVPKNTDEVMTMIAKKDLANYEKLPFWYTKNAWYQSNASSKLQTTTSGGNFNKFVATNIVSKGEIPNGSVVVTMGGDFGYRPEGWENASTKTATRPDRVSEQVTEVTDAWWTSGSQTFTMRGFNLDKGTGNLSDTELEGVIESFAVYVPKPTKAKPDPDAVFTTAGYKLEDYKKLELTYNKYAFYDSKNSGVIQNKENVPTATNLGQFVATGIIDKANIPNGSVLVVCDGYQYRPEGWQVNGEKNTADRPGNVTTATVVVDDAWWGNFNYRAFNLAYAGNPGIPVTEMDHVIASFAIYVPKADPDPTHIDTAEKLVAFLKAATAETTTDYIMTKDVDMKGVTVPTAAGFKGTFDGKGKTIKNLAATAPLFATLDGTVKNVTLEGAFTPTGGTFGVLAGTSSGSIEGVTNKATVTLSAEDLNAETLIAGIVGNSTGTIKNCTNSGAVTVSSALSLANVAVAGVVAKASGALESVYNNGDVSVSTLYCVARPSATIEANPVFAPCVGGILGIAVSGTTITTGKNTGKVTFIASKIETLNTANVERVMIGGVAGAPAGNITSVDNEGDVLVQAITSDRTAATKGFITCVGGISGGDYYAGASQSLTNITNCTNAGKITVDTDASASNSAIGGIVGWPGVEGDTQNTLTKNCINKGAVTVSGAGKCRIGGIAGGAGSLEACKNYGTITSNLVGASGGTLGGVLGYSAKLVVGTVTNCESYGDVICNDTLNQTYVGALIGAHGSPNDFATDPAKIVGGIINCNIVVKGDQKYVGFAMGRYNGAGKSGRYMSLGTAESPVVIKGGSITLGETKTALTSENYKPFLAGTERACVVKVAGEDDVVIGSGSNSDRRPIYVKWEP